MLCIVYNSTTRVRESLICLLRGFSVTFALHFWWDLDALLVEVAVYFEMEMYRGGMIRPYSSSELLVPLRAILAAACSYSVVPGMAVSTYLALTPRKEGKRPNGKI